jgi:sporulation protein YlmC with PRC-barrel domain
MDTKRIKGLPVINLAGVKLGTIAGIYLDPATKRVVGFGLQANPGLPGVASTGLIDADDVHALGADALTLSDTTALRGTATSAQFTALVEMDELAKRQVVMDGGILVGQVAAIELDPETLRLARIEVSPGFFKSNKSIPAEQVISLGVDAVMVAVAAGAAPEAATPTTDDGARRGESVPAEPGEPASASDFRGDFATGAGGRLNAVAPDADTERAGGPVVVQEEDVAAARAG